MLCKVIISKKRRRDRNFSHKFYLRSEICEEEDVKLFREVNTRVRWEIEEIEEGESENIHSVKVDEEGEFCSAEGRIVRRENKRRNRSLESSPERNPISGSRSCRTKKTGSDN